MALVFFLGNRRECATPERGLGALVGYYLLRFVKLIITGSSLEIV